MKTIIDVYKVEWIKEKEDFFYVVDRFNDRVCSTTELDCPPDKNPKNCPLRCRLKKLQSRNNGGVGYKASGNLLSFPEKVKGNKEIFNLRAIKGTICGECLRKYRLSFREQHVYGPC